MTNTHRTITFIHYTLALFIHHHLFPIDKKNWTCSYYSSFNSRILDYYNEVPLLPSEWRKARLRPRPRGIPGLPASLSWGLWARIPPSKIPSLLLLLHFRIMILPKDHLQLRTRVGDIWICVMCPFSPPRSALTVFISLGGVIFASITRTWDSVKDFGIVTEVDPPLGIPVSHLKYPSWISTQIMIWEIDIHVQIHWDDSVLSNCQVCIPYSIVANLILVCDRNPIVRIHFFFNCKLSMLEAESEVAL